MIRVLAALSLAAGLWLAPTSFAAPPPGHWFQSQDGKNWYIGVLSSQSANNQAMVRTHALAKLKSWLAKDFSNWNIAPGNLRLRRDLKPGETMVLYALNLSNGNFAFVQVSTLGDIVVLSTNDRPMQTLRADRPNTVTYPPMAMVLQLAPGKPRRVIYEFDMTALKVKGVPPNLAAQVKNNAPGEVPPGAGKTSSVLRIANGTGQSLDLWVKFRFYQGKKLGWVWQKQGPIAMKKDGFVTITVGKKPVFVDAYYLFAQTTNGFRTYGSWDKEVFVKDKIVSTSLATHELQ